MAPLPQSAWTDSAGTDRFAATARHPGAAPFPAPRPGAVAEDGQDWKSPLRTIMGGKIHRATVTDANLDYEGSITLDPHLMEAAGILPYEQVHVLDATNGARLETYAIQGRAGSGEVCINGAAAHLVQRGDIVIIIAYQQMTDDEAKRAASRHVYVDGANRITRTSLGDGFAHNASLQPVSA